MSWELVSFAIVAVAVAGGLWWYERTRPSSKELALVATMAALNALGRDAFAALPDVKPTTVIALICGYAFGAGPGFAVGAFGALASNFMLGQGSWTPWQMLAWGGVGVAGAILSRLRRGAIPGRLELALACAILAEAFNLVMDFYTWTLGGVHTFAAYIAWVASAATFDLTHVVASFVFGFAFGPALLRMLIRARTRLEVVWREPAPATPIRLGRMPGGGSAITIMALASVAVSLGLASSARARDIPSASSAIDRGVSYLRDAQSSDGGFGATVGQAGDELYTAWAAIGLAAAGRDPSSVRRDGHNVLSELSAQARTLSGPGDMERTILALRACGVSDRSIGGVDLVSQLLKSREANGSFGDLVNITSFAIFALRAIGYSSSDPAVLAAGRWIAHQEDSDGGFSFGTGGGVSDVDDTSAALQALADSGQDSGRVKVHALAYLRRAQESDGGFPEEVGGLPDAQSTAWAVQGLVAAGSDPNDFTRSGGRSPMQYLESMQASNGSFRYSAESAQTPVWVTAQVLAALALKPFPIAAPAG